MAVLICLVRILYDFPTLSLIRRFVFGENTYTRTEITVSWLLFLYFYYFCFLASLYNYNIFRRGTFITVYNFNSNFHKHIWNILIIINNYQLTRILEVPCPHNHLVIILEVQNHKEIRNLYEFGSENKNKNRTYKFWFQMF